MEKKLVFSNEKKAIKKLKHLEAQGKFAWIETFRKYDKHKNNYEESFIIWYM